MHFSLKAIDVIIENTDKSIVTTIRHSLKDNFFYNKHYTTKEQKKK